MGRLGLIGLEQPVRYECSRLGELVHLDVKKLGRIEGGAGKRFTGVKRYPKPRRRDAHGIDRGLIGWEYVHVAVDDYSRYAYVEVLANEKAATAANFLRRAVDAFARRGIRIERILTDNGACYRGALHALAWRRRLTGRRDQTASGPTLPARGDFSRQPEGHPTHAPTGT